VSKYKKLLLVILLIAGILRFWKISEVPVSLFGDELDVGYHAYSILKTGRDYSGNFMPIHFQSLAEWRTPLYLYSAVPTVALFGISPLGVRLPAAFFGVLGVWALFLLIKELTKNELIALVSSVVMAFSPWHIQYSRAAFEVTELLVFLLFGLYFFLKALKESRYLWIAATFLTFTPWIYSTAKLFAPVLLLFLFTVWRKELLKFPRKDLVKAAVAGLLIGLPIAYSTLFGGGLQRAGHLSIFTDPTRETEVGVARQTDARMRGEMGEGLQPTAFDKLTHNKVTFWTERIVGNYLQAFSTEFLFVKGDLNLRHSIDGVGQFYWIEAVTLLMGVILFFTKYKDRRAKLFLAFWILFGVVPSAITRDGGRHATRLILILPPLVFLTAFGLVEGLSLIKFPLRKLAAIAYLGIWILEFGFYQHNFWIHNPWNAERWWHAGFKESILTIKEIDKDYDRIIISMAGEPAWIFFAGWYEYPPDKWHEGFPFKKQFVEGFGEISFIDKFFFGTPDADIEIYGLARVIDSRTLYMANAKEIGANLIREPSRTPEELVLIKAIAYPSGEPAFYLFSKKP